RRLTGVSVPGGSLRSSPPTVFSISLLLISMDPKLEDGISCNLPVIKGNGIILKYLPGFVSLAGNHHHVTGPSHFHGPLNGLRPVGYRLVAGSVFHPVYPG